MGGNALKTDIVVLGGGISGLLIAAELSRYHQVVLIEKDRRKQRQNKYWVTPSGLNSVSLGGHIDQRYQHMDFISFDGTTRRLRGDFILWDGDAVTSHLYDVAQGNGCTFLFEHNFFSFRRTPGKITVQCEEKEIECALLVDCMGWQSPFALAFSLAKLTGYYFAVGAEMEAVEHIDPICMHNIRFGVHARYLEVFPRENGRAFVSLISPLSSLTLRSEISREFHFILDHTPYRSRVRKIRDGEPLFGIVPVGIIRKQAMDNVYLFGEAGFTHPVATGACLTAMLRVLPSVVEGLAKCVTDGRLRASDLGAVESGLTTLNRKFQLNLYREVLSWTSTDFSDVLKRLENVDDEMISRVLFGDIEVSSALTATNIIRLARNGNWPLVRSIARTLFTWI